MDFYAAIQSAPGYGHIAPQSLAQFAPQGKTHEKLEKKMEKENTETDRLGLSLRDHSSIHRQLQQVYGSQDNSNPGLIKIDINGQTDLAKQNLILREQLQLASETKADMERQNSILREQLKGMRETGDAFELSCKLKPFDPQTPTLCPKLNPKMTTNPQIIQATAQNVALSQADSQPTRILSLNDETVVTKLQEQLKAARDTVEALNLTCRATEDKILLQSQLHADKLRLMEVTHSTLQERCKILSASAEQHRTANILLEERHKSMTKDLEVLGQGANAVKDREIDTLKAMVCAKDRDLSHLQSLVKARDEDIISLQSVVATKDKNINLLQSIASTKNTDTQKPHQSLRNDEEIRVLSEGFSGIIRDKEAEILRLNSKLSHLNTQISALHSNVSTLNAEMETKDKEVSRLTAECMSRLHTALQAEEEVRGVSKSFHGVIREKESEILGLKSEISRLSSEIKVHQGAIEKVAAECADKLRDKDKETARLTSQINASTEESKRLQKKLIVRQSLLRSHPIDPCLNKKTRTVIQSSAEILGLAHDKGSTESMRECLGQVCNVLKDLHDQLDTHHRLSGVWLEQVQSV